MSGRVLVVDDEKNITFVVQAILERAGYRVTAVNQSSQALKLLADRVASEDVQAVLTDLYMPGAGGMDLLDYCKRHHPRVPVVIMTAFGTVESAVSALKLGAFDYITKPFDQAELLGVLQKAVATFQKRQTEPVSLTSNGSESALPAASASPSSGVQPSVTPAISSIVGESAQMQEIFRVTSKIAQSPSTVLITGESGTGKELVAFEIHHQSNRKDKSFIKVNCAAIPGTLIESELFGYEKGAFTGAVNSKPGRFELAHEGTLFLDEVADMPIEMQVKLLRALQEHEFERVGGVSTIKVDVRIIAATNKDLEAEVKAGRFREDLFYRLNVVPIRLPALRERREDIDLLVRHFVIQFNEKLKKEVTALTPQVLSALRIFPWPGNIRQLENVLERTVLMCEGSVLRLEDLPEEIVAHAKAAGLLDDWEMDSGEDAQAISSEQDPPVSFKELVKRQTQNVERELIEKALEETAGVVTRAAEKLGLSRKGLQLKMKELGIKRPERG